MQHPSDVPGIPARSVSARGRGAAAAVAGRGGGGASAPTAVSDLTAHLAGAPPCTIKSYLRGRDKINAEALKNARYLQEGGEPWNELDQRLLRELRGRAEVDKRFGHRIADPRKLRGFRLAAYLALASGGEGGVSRSEYEARFVRSIPPGKAEAFAASGDRRKLMRQARRYLYDNAFALNVVVERGTGGWWRLTHGPAENARIVPPKRRRKPK
jgi:hypothetical protein